MGPVLCYFTTGWVLLFTTSQPDGSCLLPQPDGSCPMLLHIQMGPVHCHFTARWVLSFTTSQPDGSCLPLHSQMGPVIYHFTARWVLSCHYHFNHLYFVFPHGSCASPQLLAWPFLHLMSERAMFYGSWHWKKTYPSPFVIKYCLSFILWPWKEH